MKLRRTVRYRADGMQTFSPPPAILLQPPRASHNCRNFGAWRPHFKTPGVPCFLSLSCRSGYRSDAAQRWPVGCHSEHVQHIEHAAHWLSLKKRCGKCGNAENPANPRQCWVCFPHFSSAGLIFPHLLGRSSSANVRHVFKPWPVLITGVRSVLIQPREKKPATTPPGAGGWLLNPRRPTAKT